MDDEVGLFAGREWAVVDVETSGFRTGQHRVLSLAVITLDGRGERVEEYATLLDPGVDPGPVEIHGLTRERLAGAPQFADVAERVAGMLSGRVMVAHNAQFDYDFLQREFAAAGIVIPVAERLCTLALNRRIGPPTANYRLGTLAAHYGVPQQNWHDALDDTRVLTGILSRSFAEAARLGIALPFVTCPPRTSGFPANVPKARCLYRSPGRLADGAPLVQGMKVAITGDTGVPRIELVARAVAAGLNVMTSISRHTSVLVANDVGSGTGKAQRALAEGVPVIDEAAFLALLGDVRPGQRLDDKPTPIDRVPRPRAASPVGPLAGHRILVLGGGHREAAAARARVSELGGAVSTNLTAKVTDLVLLRDAEQDGRIDRARRLGLPLHPAKWLDGPGAAPGVSDVVVLSRGHVIDLPTDAATTWTIAATWAQQTAGDVDLVAFALDEAGQVTADEDFVFYGSPATSDGTVSLAYDGPADQSITVDLIALPARVDRVLVAAAIGAPDTFSAVGAIEITASAEQTPHAQATLDAATTERTLVLADLYRRDGRWRLRAVGQGYDHDLAALARSHGVDVADA